MNGNYEEKVLELKALSDKNRLVIIDFLKDGERCACKILEQLRISQPTLSHHMKILCETELVHWRKDGKWMHYSLNRNKFKEFREFFEGFAEMEDDDGSGNCC
jgi:ArsR family transcriptional regulator, arsenate/arsenite/antimonite-responsive transcriptional repressor